MKINKLAIKKKTTTMLRQTKRSWRSSFEL